MSIKAILFDADGVTISSKRFSEKLRDEYGIALEDFLEFYHAEMQDCLVGKADLKQVLPKYIERWGYPGDVNDLIEEWCQYENEPEDDMLELVDALRSQGVVCYLITDNEKYRTKFIEEKMEYAERFDSVISSCHLGTTKDKNGFYEAVLTDLDLDPDEVLLVDDKKANISAAQAVGLETILFRDYDQFLAELEDFGFEDIEFE